MDTPLKEIIQKVVEEVDPDKIILFGSRAKGKDRKESDYDLCVLKRNLSDKGKVTEQIYLKLFGTGVPVDIIVIDPENFKKLKNKSYLIYSEIAKHGRAIYEK